MSVSVSVPTTYLVILTKFIGKLDARLHFLLKLKLEKIIIIMFYTTEYTRVLLELEIRVRFESSLAKNATSIFERVLELVKNFELFRVEYFRVKSQH